MTEQQPRVSIVIPTYNRSQMLKEALESIRAQTEACWEVIVVNNHSDDDTLQMIETLSDPRISVINFHNHGVIGASRNRGIQAARGEWIAFLDSDDTYRPRKLERCLAEATDDIDVINHRFAKKKDGIEFWQSPRHGQDAASYRNMFFKDNCLAPLTCLVRKDFLEKTAGFSEEPDLMTAEDRDLWLRFAENGVRVTFIDDILADYRVHDAGASRRIDIHMQSSLHVIDAHAPRIMPKKAFDGMRVQRQRALVVYSAGRSHCQTGERTRGIRLLVRSLSMYPFNLRVYIAIMLAFIR